MKILWITNVVFPFPSKCIGQEQTPFGGWLLGLFNYIKGENKIDLAIASVYNGKKLLKYKEDNVTYYLLPKVKDLRQHWIDINNEYNPDLVHIHGTEYHYRI